MRKNQRSVLCNKNRIREEEQEIRQILRGSVAYLEAPDRMKRQIDLRISEELEKEKKMKKQKKQFSAKKVIGGVAAACLVAGMVCIAGSGMRSLIGSSSIFPDYTSFSDLEKAEGKTGYQVKAVENFSNGFTFKSITISDEAMIDEAGKKMESQKGLHISYEKGDEDITLYIRRLYAEEACRTEALDVSVYDRTILADGVQAGFRQIENKFVPPDYVLTEEDMENMENPNFNLAYGTDEVEMNTGFSASWIQDGILYELYGTDLSVSGDEMLEMAREIIEM